MNVFTETLSQQKRLIMILNWMGHASVKIKEAAAFFEKCHPSISATFLRLKLFVKMFVPGQRVGVNLPISLKRP